AGGALPNLSADRGGSEHRGVLAPLAGLAVLARRADVVPVAAALVGCVGGRDLSAGRPASRRGVAAVGLCAPPARAVSRRLCGSGGDCLCAAGADLWPVRLGTSWALLVAAEPAAALCALFLYRRGDWRLRHRARVAGRGRSARATLADVVHRSAGLLCAVA